jgi:hypothetical protein
MNTHKSLTSHQREKKDCTNRQQTNSYKAVMFENNENRQNLAAQGRVTLAVNGNRIHLKDLSFYLLTLDLNSCTYKILKILTYCKFRLKIFENVFLGIGNSEGLIARAEPHFFENRAPARSFTSSNPR